MSSVVSVAEYRRVSDDTGTLQSLHFLLILFLRSKHQQGVRHFCLKSSEVGKKVSKNLTSEMNVQHFLKVVY